MPDRHRGKRGIFDGAHASDRQSARRRDRGAGRIPAEAIAAADGARRPADQPPRRRRVSASWRAIGCGSRAPN
jgi:hypothetical protein